MTLALIGKLALALLLAFAALRSGASALQAAAILAVALAVQHALLARGQAQASASRQDVYRLDASREIVFWAFVAAILLLALAAGAALTLGAVSVGATRPVDAGSTTIVAVGLALILAAGLAWLAWSEARSVVVVASEGVEGDAPEQALSDDPASYSGLLEAGLGLAAIFVAGLGILLLQSGWAAADSIAAIAVGLAALGAAVWLARHTYGLLRGGTPDIDLIEDIIGLAGQARFVDAVNEVRTMEFGPADVLVNLSVDARDQMTAGEVEADSAALEARIRARHPEVSRVFIELQSAVLDDGTEGVAAEPG